MDEPKRECRNCVRLIVSGKTIVWRLWCSRWQCLVALTHTCERWSGEER